MMHQISSQHNRHTWPTWPFFSDDQLQAVNNVLKSGKVNYWTGDECRLFEQAYAHFVGTPYAVTLMNGTVALEAALYALDIGPGDEVITTSRTFIASASAIVLRGAKPVLADVDPISQNLTVESVEKLITPRTKAIIAVHLAGWPCDMAGLLALAKHYGLYVVEDCAQAHGAAIYDRQVGAWGDIAAFSFCQDKIMTTGGEGGMITTHHHAYWKKIWSFKDHGKSYSSIYGRQPATGFRWVHESFGTNWRMTEMQAAIGRIQLQKLSHWVQIRQRNAGILNQALDALPILRVTLPPEPIQHAYYKYYVFLRPEYLKSDWSRDRILKTLQARGVPCFTGSCSEIYLEEAFVQAGLQLEKRLPVAKMLGETSLMFLVHPTLTEKDMYEMADIILDVVTQASQSHRQHTSL